MKAKVVSLILGGGAGTRLFPLTKDRSKPAVPIAAKYRLIDIPISNCLNSGLKKMFVLTQYNSASLNKHVKNTYHFDLFTNGFVDIIAAEQTPASSEWFQGTADAVKQSMMHTVNIEFDYILILSGDQLYQMDFQEMIKTHQQSNAEITIATIPVVAEDATAFGIMKVNERGAIESFVEKPPMDELPNWTSQVSEKFRGQGKNYLASMGIYIFNKNILKRLFASYPEAIDFGKQIIPSAIETGFRVFSYAYDGYWTDIGNISSFFEANISLTDDIPQFNLFDDEKNIYTHPRNLAPSKIMNTKINQVLIADGCIIHADEVSRSVVGIRSRIGSQSIIRNSILMGNDYFETLEKIIQRDQIALGIGNNCHIENAIIDKNCRIGHDVSICGSPELEDEETEEYVIKDGIIVLKKKAVIADGTKIGKLKN